MRDDFVPPFRLMLDADGDAWLIDACDNVVVDYESESPEAERDWTWRGISATKPVIEHPFPEELVAGAQVWARYNYHAFLDSATTTAEQNRRRWTKFALGIIDRKKG